MKKTLLLLSAVLLFLMPVKANAQAIDSAFVKTDGTQLMRYGQPYRFVGTNMWYGAILGSTGQGGNRDRLCRELDHLKSLGIDNLRILVGSDGLPGPKAKVEPNLQLAPGVYNDTILAGLDYLLMEMGKRQMVAVLYLNNSWEWSGGYGFYLFHAEEGVSPQPNIDGYDAYVEYAAKFATNEIAHQLFYNHIRFILSRTNRYTGVRYTDDPAIMSWQIGNEPRAFAPEALPAFEQWLAEAAALIKSIDGRHLVSVGSEGAVGSGGDYDSWTRICADPNIDYCNIHVWPTNWGWARRDHVHEDLGKACEKSAEYIARHVRIADSIRKPLVMEEFGYPRNDYAFTLSSKTSDRDTYYKYIFNIMKDNWRRHGCLAGCNFWAWGGEARPQHEQWQLGDDYAGDPAQEPQGLFSIFSSDESTLKIIGKVGTEK